MATENLMHSPIITGDNLVFKVAALGGTLVICHLGYTYFTSPLREFPGPVLAKFTDLWRVWDYFATTQIESHQKLHAKHGPAVRIGPNMISLSDPALLKTVYSTRGEFVKSDFYEVGDAVADGHRIENVFSTRSNVFHAKYMKPFVKFFAPSEVLAKESLSDKTVALLCEKLEAEFMDGKNPGKIADLSRWIEYCCWDFDWAVTFSQDMGFLKTASDVQGLVHTGERTMRYLGCIGQMPWLDRVLGKNPWCPIKFATFENAAFYCYQKMMERVSGSAKPEGNADFLDNFLSAKEQHPDVVDDNVVVSYLMMNVLAGADTTAIVQKAIVWYILSNPEAHKKLNEELDAIDLSFPTQYEQTKNLPYLNACIKEGQRMHPVIGGILERIVPAEGLTLPDGRFIAAGTKVGISAWVSSRNKDVYGEDADEFRPERWLKSSGEGEEEYELRLKRMKDSDFTFGGGRRVCTGQHLAAMELHKITATLFKNYEITLDGGSKQWSPRWWWFTFVDDINVRLQRR